MEEEEEDIFIGFSEDTFMGFSEDTVRELERDHEEAGKWNEELADAGIEHLEAIKQAAGEMLERTNSRTELLSKTIDACLEGNTNILKQLTGWAVKGMMTGLEFLTRGITYHKSPPTGRFEMRVVKEILKTLRKLLSTDKELSVRLCSLLKDIDKLINQKLEENEQKKNLRLEAEKKEKEEERKELEHAKSICSCT